MMFQWPAVGAGSFFMFTSITTGLFSAMARSSAGLSSAAEFKPALAKAIKSKRPVVLDVYMKNEPVPTAGHWNIMDIYSPGRKVHHVGTGD